MPEVRAYGDTEGDGMVQVSFTLPVPSDGLAREVGRHFLLRLGLEEPQVVHAAPAGAGLTFYIGYGRAGAAVDPVAVAAQAAAEPQAAGLGFDEVNERILALLGRPAVVLGAAIESDAHTVGIDAIMNMKGFAGDHGLESYPAIEAVNLGAQVPCERLLREARERRADAILVSQVVTQKQVHARQLTKLIDLLEAEGERERYVVACGGPRLSNTFAKELGYDAGFGPGSRPAQVAAWLARALAERGGAASACS
jgi:beta-lysine 5,6-aminomutase beta subunit